MATKTQQAHLGLLYIRWQREDPQVCTQCGSPIKYLYNDGGRFVVTLAGTLKLYTCYYVCTNSSCPFSTPFTLPQDIVLPYKHYGLDVWCWVITSHIEFHDSYNAIAKRLNAYYGLGIAPNTVKAIIETYLVASSHEAEQRTLQLVRESGQLYVAVDGQRPNNGESGLWLFIDTITNRILHLEYLKSARWEVLKAIFEKIEAKYGVPIKAVVSDHQASIIKAVQEFSPTIPHQFCHYHFLKNLHRAVNALDSHLHVKLAEAIHQLYICHLSPLSKPLLLHGRELDRTEWVAPIVRDLIQIIGERSRDFDLFAGFKSYQSLTQYLKLLLQLSQTVLGIPPLHNLIKQTIIKIKKALKAQTPLFRKLEQLLPLFHQIREILGRAPLPTSRVQPAAAQWVQRLQALYQSLTGHPVPHPLKWQRISAETPLDQILAEWIRLYSTHKRGLFHYLTLEQLPRSNVPLEKIFSLELHHFRAAAGRTQVGNLVRVKGGELCIVQQNYTPESIKRILLHHDRRKVKAGIAQFRKRHRLQSATWHTRQDRPLGIHQLIKDTQILVSPP